MTFCYATDLVFLIYSKVFGGRTVLSRRAGGQAGASSSVIRLVSQRAARVRTLPI